jgi:tetratricopeptide (TPR) repeat protein
MKNLLNTITFIGLSLFISNCKSGLVTMPNGCYNAINNGQAQNKAGNYTGALDNFNTVLNKCDAYDAKEKAYAGKAEALNGLKQFSDAMTAANAGLKINPSSIDNLFGRANAEMATGMIDNAKADLNTIIDLTAKNRNVADRATIYSKVAEAEMRQQLYNDALQNINQAISMDNTNLSFYMQRGDINVAAGNLSTALGNYDEAISRGKNDAEAWKARTTTLIKIDQQKYGTDNASTLGKKLSAADRQSLCNSIQTAQGRGMRDMNIDLLQAAVCK